MTAMGWIHQIIKVALLWPGFSPKCTLLTFLPSEIFIESMWVLSPLKVTSAPHFCRNKFNGVQQGKQPGFCFFWDQTLSRYVRRMQRLQSLTLSHSVSWLRKSQQNRQSKDKYRVKGVESKGSERQRWNRRDRVSLRRTEFLWDLFSHHL